jgi:hypothetical protein
MQIFGNHQRLKHLPFRIHMNGTIGTYRLGTAQLFLYRQAADTRYHYLLGDTALFQAHSLFHSNFAEGIKGHFGTSDIHRTAIRFWPDTDTVVNYTFNSYQDFQASFLAGIRWEEFITQGEIPSKHRLLIEVRCTESQPELKYPTTVTAKPTPPLHLLDDSLPIKHNLPVFDDPEQNTPTTEF